MEIFFSYSFSDGPEEKGIKPAKTQVVEHIIGTWLTHLAQSHTQWAINLNLTSEVPQKLTPYLPVKKITAGMNSDGICAQPVRSSRQEGTITSSPTKPQIAQLIYLNIPQKVM